MTKLTMCDTKTFNWCGRIGLLLSICAILCIMMFQIWSYYFSLVAEMDALVLSSPQVHGILDICKGNVRNSWNVENCILNNDTLYCDVPSVINNLFIDSGSTATFLLNNTVLTMHPGNACARVLLWILPW